jgi:hypothetical protein
MGMDAGSESSIKGVWLILAVKYSLEQDVLLGPLQPAVVWRLLLALHEHLVAVATPGLQRGFSLKSLQFVVSHAESLLSFFLDLPHVLLGYGEAFLRIRQVSYSIHACIKLISLLIVGELAG